MPKLGVDSLEEGVESRRGRLKSAEFFNLLIGGLGGTLLGDLLGDREDDDDNDVGFGGGEGLSPEGSPGFLGGGRGLYFFDCPLLVALSSLERSEVDRVLLASTLKFSTDLGR